MGLTVSNLNPGVAGNKRRNTLDITFDSSYPTGGESLTPAALGLVSVDIVLATGTGGYVFKYDKANQKLLAYTGGSQVSDTTDLSSVTTRVEAVGF